MTEKIRIVLIDDHTLFRSGIKALLARQENYEVVGEAADGLSGVKLVSQLEPDVVLLVLAVLAVAAGLVLAHRWRPHDTIRQLRRRTTRPEEAR